MINRVINDYFMKDRYGEYRSVLESFLQHGFQFVRVRDFGTSELESCDKILCLRHDIDSDIKIAGKMFQIEKDLGIKSTYYFRLSTMDLAFMGEIKDYGCEVGYHYEEIASFAKAKRLKDPADVRRNMPEIRKLFAKNVKMFERKLDGKLESVASHGDFVNRKLGIPNKVLVTERLLQGLGVRWEAYDVEEGLDFRIADKIYPEFFGPVTPEEIVDSAECRRGLVLVHPRQWDSAPFGRIRLDFNRLFEGARY